MTRQALTTSQALDQYVGAVWAPNDLIEVRADSILFRTLGKTQVIGELPGLVKIVSDAENRRILGVHMIGPHATDLIAEGVLAIEKEATVEDLANTIHAHPTLAEGMYEAALKALDRSLHG